MICVFNLDDETATLTVPLDEKKIFFTEIISNEEGSVGGTNTNVDLPITMPGNSVRIYKIKTLSKSK